MPNPVSRQVGSFSWGDTSETVSITPVSDATKTLVQAQYRGTEAGMDRQTFSVELTSTSTLQFERIDRNGATEIEWEVVEFDDADLSVEHVSDLAIGVNAIGTKDLTRTVVISNGNTSLAGDDRARNYVELELTAVGELTARYRTGWPVAGVCAQVLQLPAADVESLQVVSTAAVPFTASITSVDETKTLTFGTGYADSTDGIFNSGHGTLDLASATSLEAVRSDGTATAITLDYTAYVLELTGSDVQRVSEVFSDTDLSLTASLNPVVAASTSVFAGGWAGNVRWKQGDSLSAGGNSEGAFTATLNGTTGVDFERGVVGTTGASSSPLAQVVEWQSASTPLIEWTDDGASVNFDAIAGTVTIGAANLDGNNAPAATSGNLRSAAGGPTALLGSTPSGMDVYIILDSFAGAGSTAATSTALWSIDDGSLTVGFDGTSVYAEYDGAPTITASDTIDISTGLHVIRVSLDLPDITLQVNDRTPVTASNGSTSYQTFAGTERFHIGGNVATPTAPTATFAGYAVYLYDAALSAADRASMYGYLSNTYPTVTVP
jgi:hypothetical protein